MKYSCQSLKKRQPYDHTCPCCGANLDPGERFDYESAGNSDKSLRRGGRLMPFSTTDRKLEQFLYAHFIPFDNQSKNMHGLNVWHYTKTPRLLRTVREYKTLNEQFGNPRREAARHD